MFNLRVLVLALVFCSPAFRLSAQDEDQKLAAVFQTWLTDFFALRPLEATELGDHRFDAQLEDLTPDGRARWLAQMRQMLADLPGRVDYQKLSRAAQIDFETFQHDLTTRIWLAENTHPYLDDPRS